MFRSRRLALVKKLFLLFLLLLAPCLASPELDGRQVLLVISAERTDRDGEWLELALRGLRHRLGLTANDLPVVRMGFQDADQAHLKTLEIAAEDSPVVALVRWKAPASKGPGEVVGENLSRRAFRSAGLEAPREILKAWLVAEGRQELVARLEEPPERPAPEQAPEEPEPGFTPIDPAQLAYDEFRFDDAIKEARVNGDAALEERARRAYHQQAALALAEGRKDLALSVYTALRDFYPADSFYSAKVKELSRDPASLIHGRWKLHSNIGWAEIQAHPDGRLEARAASWILKREVKWEGHWEMTGATERTFQFHWKTGNLHDLTVSEDERTFQGSGLHEGRITGRRLD